ncbi:MAG: LysM peptidoglycan-binding domain-containing protein [Clostridia bacterium]|nr:LysM peptidoglycan-binding domain-containing protein [Clostridia bacterium]
MKGSKKFGKSILAIVLSLMLIISAVAPLTVMGSDNNGGGDKGTPLGQYRYYSVKSGDTLASIASKNGVTVSDIMTYNGLDSTDKIYRGQILKVPVTSANKENQVISSSISIKAKDSNVKDLISSIAYNAGYKVIFKGAGTETVTIDLNKVSPLKAIDYVTRMVGLSYLKDGNTILVASASELNSTFVDSLVLTKFSFKYITYQELLGQASALGLSNMKNVAQTNNGRDVWISAYPKEMAKLAELVEILDAPENISVGSNSIAAAFTPIELDYIPASDFSNLLGSLGLHTGITMTAYPMTLFVYVSGTQFSDIMTIKKVVDTEKAITNDNKPGDTIVVPDGGTNDEPTTDAPAGDVNDNTNNDTNNDTNVNDTPTEEPVQEPYVLEKIEFVNLERSDVEGYIRTQVSDVTFYGHSRMTKAVWVYAKESDVAKAKELIETIDASVPAAASTVHTYTATNCSVETLMSRLSDVNIEGVTFQTYDYSNLTNSIIVYCDASTWNNQVYDLLVSFDTAHTVEATWIPLESKEGDTRALAEDPLNERLAVMKELYPEVFNGVEYKVVVLEQKTTDKTTYKAVLYAKTTSDKASRMTSLLDAMDNA